MFFISNDPYWLNNSYGALEGQYHDDFLTLVVNPFREKCISTFRMIHWQQYVAGGWYSLPMNSMI